MGKHIKTAKTDKREHHYLDRMSHHSRSYPEFHWPSVEVLLNFLYTYDVIYTYISRELDHYGLSATAFNILMILSRSEEKGCQMHELSELLLVTRANITGLVDSLEKKRLVKRVGSTNDRRVRIVRITKAGERLLESILPCHYQRIQKLLGGLSAAEKIKLSEVLTKLRHGAQDWVASDESVLLS